MQKDLIVRKPWGYEYSVVNGDNISVRVLHIAKGEETSFHCHLEKDVLIILLKGRAKLSRSGNTTDYMEDVELKTMFVRQIPKSIFHKTIALEDSIVLEIESSGNVYDLVRGVDKYNRKGGYEANKILTVDEELNKSME